jgi:subfamily B ATP-binding cassette protein MsbA
MAMKAEISHIGDMFKTSHSKSWQDDLAVIWRLSRPYIWRLIAALLLSLMLSGINGAIAWAVKPALDAIFLEKSSAYAAMLPAAVILLFVMRGTFAYLNNYLMSSIGAKIVKWLRRQIYDKLLGLPLSFYSRTDSGSVVSKMLNDIEIMHRTVAYTIKDFLVESSTVVVLAFVAIYRRWDLALLSFVVIPAILFSIGKLGSMMKKVSVNTRRFISNVTSILHETLQGVKIIKAFTMEKEMSGRYEEALAKHYRNTMREVRISEFSTLMTEILGGIGVAVILFYGSNLVISGQISPGEFFSFIAAVLMIYTPLRRLSRANNNFQQSRAVLDRLREVVFVDTERKGGIEKDIHGHIRFENVSFKYPFSETYAVRDVSLEIRPGEVIALVGHTGAGKSTIADMTAGFWHPTEGDIFIDDININDLSLTSLRKHIGIVTQDVILFNDTARANILFGRPDAAEKEVIEAAKGAYAHDFIKELQEGYETNIGERGVKLSGGQKQRISIARAILRNPSILILDEATSSLDVESEHKVQMALEKLMSGRTTIVIAHRLSTIKKATRILVMNRGRIVQQGSHDELMAQGGLYQEWYAMQFSKTETEDIINK